MRIVVFGYDFPHFKTNHGLINLCMNGYKPIAVIGQPYINLNLPNSKLRISPLYENLKETKFICDFFNIPFLSANHNSDKSIDLIDEIKPELGVILGARILDNKLLSQFPRGILNTHHGYIPENRGLDTMKWAIYRNQKQAVTSHIIYRKIDQGEINH